MGDFHRDTREEVNLRSHGRRKVFPQQRKAFKVWESDIGVVEIEVESSKILIAGFENSRGLQGLRCWEGRRPKSDEGRRSKLLLASMGWKC